MAQDQVSFRNHMFMDVPVCLSSCCFGSACLIHRGKSSLKFFPT